MKVLKNYYLFTVHEIYGEGHHHAAQVHDAELHIECIAEEHSYAINKATPIDLECISEEHSYAINIELGKKVTMESRDDGVAGPSSSEVVTDASYDITSANDNETEQMPVVEPIPSTSRDIIEGM